MCNLFAGCHFALFPVTVAIFEVERVTRYRVFYLSISTFCLSPHNSVDIVWVRAGFSIVVRSISLEVHFDHSQKPEIHVLFSTKYAICYMYFPFRFSRILLEFQIFCTGHVFDYSEC